MKCVPTQFYHNPENHYTTKTNMKSLSWHHLILTLGILCGCSNALASPADSPNPIRMLWLGSSSLYYHNQPKVVTEWLARHAGIPARAALAGKSGTGVHVYLRDGFKAEFGLAPGQTVLTKIRQEKFDYVVLQVPAEFINGPEGEEHDRSLDTYCKAIREAGSQPVFYEMGWGQDEKAAVGREKILAAARRNQVKLFAPCSTAWKRVRKEKPDLDLQNPPDSAHPGTLGLYLNLSCFYAVFAGKPLVDAPATLQVWRKPPDDQKNALNEKIKATTFDEYDTALAGWMKRLVVAANEEKIPDDIAKYLRKVAWEEYENFRNILK